ncbi:MAG TPA: DUF1801 domain-containing protein [Pyrinomonadaceae bacterium]|nr:DUF1801 domain-containing protein [Pyrinomonadaceae bacterium]
MKIRKGLTSYVKLESLLKMPIDDTKDLLKFLELYPLESREIALALREWLWGLYPKCNELIYDNYNFLAFGWGPTDRMSDIFCSIAVGTRGVIFGFMWGVKLDDPKGLLSGGGNQFRSLRVPDIKKFPRADVKKLIKQAFRTIAQTNKRPAASAERQNDSQIHLPKETSARNAKTPGGGSPRALSDAGRCPKSVEEKQAR